MEKVDDGVMMVCMGIVVCGVFGFFGCFVGGRLSAVDCLIHISDLIRKSILQYVCRNTVGDRFRLIRERKLSPVNRF